MSTFGHIFRVTTFGESHCKGVGVIIDGCPPCMELTEADVQPQLTRRRPGQSKLTTPRSEGDIVSIYSGTELGKTLGTPIMMMVPNLNVRPGDYKEMSQVPRPGHADYTYQVKYGTRASSGGGRSSARETIGRVAAGAVAEKFLRQRFNTEVVSFVTSVAHIDLPLEHHYEPSGRPWTRAEVDAKGRMRLLYDPAQGWRQLAPADVADEAERADQQKALDLSAETRFNQMAAADAAAGTPSSVAAYESLDDGKIYAHDGTLLEAPPANLEAWRTVDLVTLRCPHAPTSARMATEIRAVKEAHDSTGGVVCCICSNMPIGLGEPCFDKLEAKMAHAMLSLPATKGFEIGSGFRGTRQRGSAHNDAFVPHGAETKLLRTKTNNAGGTLGGISNGEDLCFKVAIKPVSTIARAQQTSTFDGTETVLEAKGRHDPCVLPRTPPLIEGMAALVLADAALIQSTRCPPGTLCSYASEHIGEGEAGGSAAAAAPKKRKL